MAPERLIRVIEVRWFDSEAIGEWQKLTDVTHVLEEVVTVGLLMYEDEHLLLIASTYDYATHSVNAAIWIPRCCIRELRELGSVAIAQN